MIDHTGMVGVFIIDLGMKYMGGGYSHMGMWYKPVRKKNQAHDRNGIRHPRKL
jgi:hypothetical protein